MTTPPPPGPARVILAARGSDRPGLTRMLAEAVHEAGGNWLESHLSLLGGAYVGSVLVEIDPAALDAFAAAIRAVDGAGLSITLAPAGEIGEPRGEELALDLIGQDRPGIVREVTTVLERLGVNIEELDTGAERGSWSGERLFRAHARLRLPEGMPADRVREALEAISGEIMVDFTFGRA